MCDNAVRAMINGCPPAFLPDCYDRLACVYLSVGVVVKCLGRSAAVLFQFLLIRANVRK